MSIGHRSHRPVLLAILLVALLLPLTATSAAAWRVSGSPDRAAAAASPVPAAFPMPGEWRTICDSIGKKGTQLVRGTNCRFLKLDGVFRRWIVDVPRDTDLPLDRAWPVVMVIHGSNSSSEEIRKRTNWPAVGAREGAIVVYPTAWRYRRLEKHRIATRWNSYKLEQEIHLDERLDGYPASAPYPARDMVFLRRVMADLGSQLTLDARRIHAAGASQGGRFISRMAVEWADTFASMSCMGWCDAPPKSVDVPRRVSILYGIGSSDHLVLDVLRRTHPGLVRIPTTWPEARWALRPLVRGHLRAWSLPDEPAEVTGSGVRLSLEWRAVDEDPQWVTRFRVMVFDGLSHVFPSPWSNSSGIDFAEIAWAFYRDHPMPPT